jgi:hypothetical protein
MDNEGVLAARKLVTGRAKALGPSLVSLARRNSGRTADQILADLRTAASSDKPGLGLLACRVIIDNADESKSHVALNKFLFRFAAHLQSSSHDVRLSMPERASLARASESAFSHLSTAFVAQIEYARENARRFSEIAVTEAAWESALGLSRADFDAALLQVVSSLSGRGQTQSREAWTVSRGSSPARSTESILEPRGAGLARSATPPPAWLGIPARAKGSRELAVTANWIPEASRDDRLLGDGLKQAWDQYSRGDYMAADNALEPVHDGLGESWLPSETADGLRTWHWFRLIHELRLLETGESMDRRRSATSAFQLATMCVPDAADLKDRLLADALQGLLASDPVSIRALCAYSVRAIRAADHVTGQVAEIVLV